MMDRRRLVAGNWKMNLTAPEGTSLAESTLDAAARRPNVDVVVCPSFTSLHPVGEALGKSAVKLGAQDVFWLERGPFTGQVSAPMLVDAGCSYCIVGHSERRGRFGSNELGHEFLPYFADTDATVALKVRSLLFANLSPILCVGETADERSARQTETVVGSQLSAALGGLDPDECFDVCVAYEPVWAIGTGNVCGAEEAARMCGFVRQRVGEALSGEAAAAIRVLYGGSVRESNCAEIFKQPQIDGALVGGASLNAEEFSRIILAA